MNEFIFQPLVNRKQVDVFILVNYVVDPKIG